VFHGSSFQTGEAPDVDLPPQVVFVAVPLEVASLGALPKWGIVAASKATKDQSAFHCGTSSGS
jgi:hypothetical protein